MEGSHRLVVDRGQHSWLWGERVGAGGLVSASRCFKASKCHGSVNKQYHSSSPPPSQSSDLLATFPPWCISLLHLFPLTNPHLPSPPI